jgi:hypothetical protein
MYLRSFRRPRDEVLTTSYEAGAGPHIGWIAINGAAGHFISSGPWHPALYAMTTALARKKRTGHLSVLCCIFETILPVDHVGSKVGGRSEAAHPSLVYSSS